MDFAGLCFCDECFILVLLVVSLWNESCFRLEFVVSIVDVFVEDHIRRLPGVYQSRGDVLHHVLAVLGNGYVWRDGVPYYEGFDDPDFIVEPYASFESYQREFDSGNGDVSKLAEKFWLEDSAVFDRIDEAVKDYSISFERYDEAELELAKVLGRFKGSFYPEHDYALLHNVPVGVHPDWLVEVGVMRSIAERYGWTFVAV